MILDFYIVCVIMRAPKVVKTGRPCLFLRVAKYREVELQWRLQGSNDFLDHDSIQILGDGNFGFHFHGLHLYWDMVSRSCRRFARAGAVKKNRREPAKSKNDSYREKCVSFVERRPFVNVDCQDLARNRHSKFVRPCNSILHLYCSILVAKRLSARTTSTALMLFELCSRLRLPLASWQRLLDLFWQPKFVRH